ncbi:Hypothetical protein, putative [Bodo saltans]|uniref:Uncharacterized protein n=1 Tax=Bodo saltans TaxID=75058 RepID=A0A0S4IYG6_BODSA|nr:Hypothetical protein, putative [Bodo saltans]|eukprot:CUF74195.1 Hypothetical protein, putative [Bodo saltans]
MRARTPRDLSNTSTRTSRADLSAAEEQLERSIASGTKSVLNGIAFPSEVARRLQRVSNVATRDTFIVSCYVDVVLDPPHRAVQQQRDSVMSPVGKTPLTTKKSQRTTKVGFNDSTNDFPGSGFATFGGADFESLVSPIAGGRGGNLFSYPPPSAIPQQRGNITPSLVGAESTQPLVEQLRSVPKGPYQVRIPTTASVGEAALMIQNAMRDVQLRERQDVMHAQKEHGKALLYSYPLSACEDIASKRLAASQKSVPTRSPPQSGLNAPRRASMLGGGLRNGMMKRRPSVTPDTTSLTPGQNTTPALRGMTLDPLFISSPLALTSDSIAKIKSTSPDDVYGGNMVSMSSLASLDFDIPRAGDVVASDSLRANKVSGEVAINGGSQSLSFGAFTAFIAEDTTPPAMKIDRNSSPTLTAPNTGVSCASAFAHRRFTIRPCDPLGRVLKIPTTVVDSMMMSSASAAAAALDVPRFEPASKPLIKCFPAGTVSFHVCLSIDGAFHREQIRELFEADAELKAEERHATELTRHDAIASKEAVWAAEDRRTVMNSIVRDRTLREHTTRPTATESYKAFLKEEANEEYEKQKQRRLAQAQADKEEYKNAVRTALKTLFTALLALDKREFATRFEMETTVERELDELHTNIKTQLDRLWRERRVAEGMTRARHSAEAVAMRAGVHDTGAIFRGL